MFLFGRTHSEIDISAAALQAFITATQENHTFENMNATQLRKHVHAILEKHIPGHTFQETKQLFNIFLNTSENTVNNIIKKKAFFPCSEVNTIFKKLEQNKYKLIPYAVDRGHDPTFSEKQRSLFRLRVFGTIFFSETSFVN